jgi:hypothetical protein
VENAKQSDGLTADERRGRIIAQLQEQAIKAGKDYARRNDERLLEIVKPIPQRREQGWLFVLAMMTYTIACIAAVVGMVALAH